MNDWNSVDSRLNPLIETLGIGWWLVGVLIGLPVAVLLFALVFPRWFSRPRLRDWLAGAIVLQAIGTLYFLSAEPGPPPDGRVESAFDTAVFFVSSGLVCWVLVGWMVLAPRRRPTPPTRPNSPANASHP